MVKKDTLTNESVLNKWPTGNWYVTYMSLPYLMRKNPSVTRDQHMITQFYQKKIAIFLYILQLRVIHVWNLLIMIVSHSKSMVTCCLSVWLRVSHVYKTFHQKLFSHTKTNLEKQVPHSLITLWSFFLNTWVNSICLYLELIISICHLCCKF